MLVDREAKSVGGDRQGQRDPLACRPSDRQPVQGDSADHKGVADSSGQGIGTNNIYIVLK